MMKSEHEDNIDGKRQKQKRNGARGIEKLSIRTPQACAETIDRQVFFSKALAYLKVSTCCMRCIAVCDGHRYLH